MGTRLTALNLRRVETPSLNEMGADPFEVDPSTACPPQAHVMLAVAGKTLHWRREAGRWMITQEYAGKVKKLLC